MCFQAVDEQEAAGKAWGIFKENTYDEDHDLYQLHGMIIVPFFVGVVDCTDAMVTMVKISGASKSEPPKPKRKRPKMIGNVVNLFPPPDNGESKKDDIDEPPPDEPPKKQ